MERQPVENLPAALHISFNCVLPFDFLKSAFSIENTVHTKVFKSRKETLKIAGRKVCLCVTT